MDIITVGEMVIDFIPGTEEGSYIRNPGGAPANVAIAAARNGLSAGIFCKVGDDAFGRFLIRTLEDNKVTPLSPQLCGEAVTTMAFVSLTPGRARICSCAYQISRKGTLGAARSFMEVPVPCQRGRPGPQPSMR